MNRKELELKYGKKLINKIMKGDYLDGCTIAIINGKDDFPEEDIKNAISRIKGEKIKYWD